MFDIGRNCFSCFIIPAETTYFCRNIFSEEIIILAWAFHFGRNSLFWPFDQSLQNIWLLPK